MVTQAVFREAQADLYLSVGWINGPFFACIALVLSLLGMLREAVQKIFDCP